MDQFQKFSTPERQISEDEMKQIKGGSGSCGFWIPSMGWKECNVDQSTAIGAATAYGGWWCCETCSATGYCGDTNT